MFVGGVRGVKPAGVVPVGEPRQFDLADLKPVEKSRTNAFVHQPPHGVVGRLPQLMLHQVEDSDRKHRRQWFDSVRASRNHSCTFGERGLTHDSPHDWQRNSGKVDCEDKQ